LAANENVLSYGKIVIQDVHSRAFMSLFSTVEKQTGMRAAIGSGNKNPNTWRYSASLSFQEIPFE
jgi:hypothetical protein